MTPHPDRLEEGSKQEPLLESSAFEDIRKDYDESDKTYEDSVLAAHAVTRVVRNTLNFSDHTRSQPELSPESVRERQATNCYGHSIVTSECFETLGIDHRIAFANQHGFITLKDPDSERIHMIDTPVERLCMDITPAIGGLATKGYHENQGEADFLWGNVILVNSSYSDKRRALQDRPWLSFLANEGGPTPITDSKNDPANRLILRTFHPETGRNTLLSFGNMVHAVLRGDTPRAHHWIQSLDGTYPDIDKRNKLRAPTRLVRRLGTAALVDEALQDIEIIENSVKPFTDDIALTLWPADERRNLGSKVGSADLLRTALEEYDRMHEYRKNLGLTLSGVENRIRTARKHLKRILNTRE